MMVVFCQANPDRIRKRAWVFTFSLRTQKVNKNSLPTVTFMDRIAALFLLTSFLSLFSALALLLTETQVSPSSDIVQVQSLIYTIHSSSVPKACVCAFVDHLVTACRVPNFRFQCSQQGVVSILRSWGSELNSSLWLAVYFSQLTFLHVYPMELAEMFILLILPLLPRLLPALTLCEVDSTCHNPPPSSRYTI